MPTITVTQVNTSATVLGVTNVNAYLNQINCLASVSEESQTTIAIPQQTYITATCGSLFANIQITPVQALATASVNLFMEMFRLTSPITDATASVRSLIAFGISQANATVSTGVVSSNLQVTPAITHATASVNPIIALGLSEANCSVTVASVFANVQAFPVQASCSTGLGSVTPRINVAVSAAVSATAGFGSVTVASSANAVGVSVTASTGSVSKSLFAFALSAPVAATAFNITPNPRIAISGVSATTTINETWGAEVAHQAHCWMVLGVLKLEILGTWEPGRGVKLRGKCDGVWLKGMSG